MASSTPFYQKVILWGVLAATMVAALLVEDEAELLVEDVVQPRANSSDSQRTYKQGHQLLSVDQLGKRQFSAKADDIFTATSWESEYLASGDMDEQAFQNRQEEIKWEPPPPPPPLAPPLRLKYLGRVISQGRVRVFLAQEDQNYAVSVGEKINTEYRVARIREEAIELVYLPLGISQVLTIK